MSLTKVKIFPPVKRRRRGELKRKLDQEVRSGAKVCRACGKSEGLGGYKQVRSDPPRFDATCKGCRAAQAREARRRGAAATV